MTNKPLFANYNPTPVRQVPAGSHATCVHPDCTNRRIRAGQDYVIEPQGMMHLACSNAAFEAAKS